MSVASISFGLLIVLFTILLLLWMREIKSAVRVWTKDVPELRTDHISAKGSLLGVWQALYSGRVLKEMNLNALFSFAERQEIKK